MLKWIAENGNPVGTPYEADYVKHKKDTTFRNLAMSLASSETGYAGLDDSTKNAYQEYKTKVTNPTAQPQPEQGYVAKAFDYARGDEQEDPNLLGKAWRGATNSPLFTRPLETVGSIGSAFIPGAGPVAQFAIPMLAGAGLSGAGNAVDQAVQTGEVNNEEVLRATAMGGLTNALGAGLGYGLKKVGAPVMKKLGEYADKMKQHTEFMGMLGDEAGSIAAAKFRLSKALGFGDPAINDLIGDVPTELVESGLKKVAKGLDLPDVLKNDEVLANSVASKASKYMQETIPELQVFGKGQVAPTESEVAKYVAERMTPPTPPDFSKPLSYVSPIPGIVDFKLLPSAMVEGVGKLSSKIAPKALPTTAIGRAVIETFVPREKHSDRVKTEIAMKNLEERRDLSETEYLNLQNILKTSLKDRTEKQKQYLGKYGY